LGLSRRGRRRILNRDLPIGQARGEYTQQDQCEACEKGRATASDDTSGRARSSQS
jgi:hypothetical protein